MQYFHRGDRVSSDAGTLGEMNSQHSLQYLLITSALSQRSISADFPVEVWTLTDPYELGGVRRFELLDETEGSYLRQCYNAMYPGMNQGSILWRTSYLAA